MLAKPVSGTGSLSPNSEGCNGSMANMCSMIAAVVEKCEGRNLRFHVMYAFTCNLRFAVGVPLATVAPS